MGIKSLYSLRPLITNCLAFAPNKVWATLLLMLVSSFSSGIGILLIVPLMASVGVDIGSATAAPGVAEKINRAIEYFGITPKLGSILILYLGLILFMATVNFFNTVVSSSLRRSFIVHMREELSRALFYTQWRYLNRAHMSDFMRLLMGQIGAASTSLHLLLTLVSSLILIAVYLVFALYISAKLTLIALICGLCLAAVLWPVNKHIHASAGIGLRANRDIHRAVFENVANLKIIKSFAAEDSYLRKMQLTNEELERQQFRITQINATTRLVNMVGAALTFTILFYAAIQWLHLPVSNLLVVLFIFSRLMPQISSIQGTLQSLIHQAPSYKDLVERTDELRCWAEPQCIDMKPPTLNNQLVLTNVSYQYLDNAKPVLKNVDATILKNETVAIVGPSGVGKSTLADLVSGLLEPATGKIMVDNHEISIGNRAAWRKRVAYVTQEVFLFHDSVKANLSWVCKENQFSSDEELEQALWRTLELAAADKFVRSLPDGLNTLIGDRGVKLSGGERQRLALARALLSEPDVLILDEATSALDRDNELKIRDALLNLDGKLTIFIIAHNETTIEHVSQRIELSR